MSMDAEVRRTALTFYRNNGGELWNEEETGTERMGSKRLSTVTVS